MLFIDMQELIDFDKNKEPPYLQYWHVNNSYGWAMSLILTVNNFMKI